MQPNFTPVKAHPHAFVPSLASIRDNSNRVIATAVPVALAPYLEWAINNAHFMESVVSTVAQFDPDHPDPEVFSRVVSVCRTMVQLSATDAILAVSRFPLDNPRDPEAM